MDTITYLDEEHNVEDIAFFLKSLLSTIMSNKDNDYLFTALSEQYDQTHYLCTMGVSPEGEDVASALDYILDLFDSIDPDVGFSYN